MRSARRALALLACLLAAGASSGCLAEDFFPEPFQWQKATTQFDDFEGVDYAVSAEFTPPARTDRLRLRANVTLQDAPDHPLAWLGAGPALNLTVVLADGRTVTYTFTESGSARDVFPAAPEGAVEVRASGRGTGDWRVDFDAYAPTYEDYAWWQAWRWGEAPEPTE